ncbi:MAG: tripartite tricarboxylate transporter substrate binding protein [Pseudomonadota bacterium]
MPNKKLSPHQGLPTTRRALIVGGASAAAALALPSLARAQSQWPSRPVRFVLPIGPGSGADITARLVADKLSAKWGGQSVVVENRPGGDGIVAITSFLGAKDDHTLLMSPTSSFTHHPWTNEKMPYDIREMVAIARMTNTIVGVAVPASSEFKTFGDLVAYAKANPGKLNWATITGFFDFIFDGFQKKMNLQIEKVPYRNTVQAATDLAEGRIQLMMSAYAILRPHIDSGKLKLLAITASQRAAVLPNVPTLAEAGFPDITIDGLVGLFGLREMPLPLRERIAADVRAVLDDPAIAQRLTATGQVVNPGGPQEFAAAMEKQQAQAAEAGRILGIKAAQ